MDIRVATTNYACNLSIVLKKILIKLMVWLWSAFRFTFVQYIEKALLSIMSCFCIIQSVFHTIDTFFHIFPQSKIFFTANQFGLCMALNETPVFFVSHKTILSSASFHFQSATYICNYNVQIAWGFIDMYLLTVVKQTW